MNLRGWRWLSSIGVINEKRSVASRHILSFWHGLGALVLGMLLAKWSWILFAPHAAVTVVAPERGVGVEAGQLFGVSASGVFQAEGAALPNVRLVGVFAAGTGKPGFAVLKLDDKQQVGVTVGESVVSGTRLLEVYPDHVLLERAGLQRQVDLEGRSVGAIGVGVAPAR